MKQRIVGVLGGMGPDATVEFMRRVLRLTPAERDSDHIAMIVHNNTKVPPRVSAILGETESPAPVLKDMARGLETAGAEFLVMPCNTAHYFLADIRSAVSIPVLNMIELAVMALSQAAPGAKTIGVLCTPGTRRAQLFDAPLRLKRLNLMFCDRQAEEELMDIIAAVKAWRISDNLQKSYRVLAQNLLNQGADALLVACTELSVLGGLQSLNAPVIDTMDALVAETIARALGSDERKSPH